MHYNCLIIDDEVDLAQMTCEYFQMYDVSCSYVENEKEFWEFIKNNQVDLILLDINLQDNSGFQICKKLRKQSDIPILFISARQSDDDVLIALNIGGDDYIKKPYSLSILLAKVKIILKRNAAHNYSVEKTVTNNQITNNQITINQIDENHITGNEIDGNWMIVDHSNIKINTGNMRVCVGDKEVQLKAKEYKLFLYLVEHKNTIVTKEELFDEVWGDSFYSDGTLNVHIRKLREKLEEDPSEPKLIKTIWGTEYILEL